MTNNDYHNDINFDQLPALQLSAVEQQAHDLTANIIHLTDEGCINLGNVFESSDRRRYIDANQMLRKAVIIEQNPIAEAPATVDTVSDMQAYRAEVALRAANIHAKPSSEQSHDDAA